jgi:hypothetical protein
MTACSVNEGGESSMANQHVIQKSVGEGGENLPTDVAFVQYLLNLSSERSGVPKKTVEEDGQMEKDDVAAIREYQAKYCKEETGGKIDPGKETMISLSKTTPTFALNDGKHYLLQDRHGKKIT